MAKKKSPEMYEGKPILVAADSDKLQEAVEKFKADFPDIPLEAPYVVRVKKKRVDFDSDDTIGVAIIPSNTVEIVNGAFSSCTNLTTVEIADSVTEIGEGVFKQCPNLKRIVIAEGNPRYDSRDNCNAIIETATDTLITGCCATVIPNSVKKIAAAAFRRHSLKSIEISNSVTEIGEETFCESSLTSIVIPDSVKNIGPAAFSYCKNLTSIEIPNSVEKIGKEAFSHCKNLTSIVIPDSVKCIDTNAFLDCIYEA